MISVGRMARMGGGALGEEGVSGAAEAASEEGSEGGEEVTVGDGEMVEFIYG